MKKGWIISFILLVGLLGLLLSQVNRDPQYVPYARINKVVPKQLQMQGPYIVHFWATWCQICQIEHPVLLQLSETHKIKWLGVLLKDSKITSTQFLHRLGNPYSKMIYDTNGNIAIDMGVYGTPETFLVDGQHKVLLRHTGILTKDIWQKQFLPIIKALEAK